MITPKIYEDDSVNDFSPNSVYRVKVPYNQSEGYVHVDNTLDRMEWLSDCIGREAVWTAEIVSPRALFSVREEGNTEGRVEFGWDENFGQHPAYVRSALVAKEKLAIPRKHLSAAWRKIASVSGKAVIPAGNVIARSAVHKITGQASQFLAFRTDDGTHFPKSKKAPAGLMKVIDSGHDPLMYYAIVSDDVFAMKETDINLWVAALSRVLTMIAGEENSWEDPRYETVKQALKDALGESMVSWNDSEFDPLLLRHNGKRFGPL